MKIKKRMILRSVAIIAILLFMSSCATVDKIFTSKRYKNATAENARLNGVIAEFQQDTLARSDRYKKLSYEYAQLEKERKELAKEYAKLNNTYNDYISSSLSNTEKLNLALKSQQDELKRKENLLNDREKRLQEFQKVVARQDSIASAINQIVKNALIGFKPEELTVELKEGKIYVSMNESLLFKSGSASVENKGKEALRMLANILQKNESIKVFVEGHTDNVPIKTTQYKDNWDLSVARATAIVRILMADNKIHPERLVASGRGEYIPIDSNQTAEGRARNRRTEIILEPNLAELYQMMVHL